MMDETKNDKFKRLTRKRSNDIQNAFFTLSRCSNPKYFEYSKEEVEELFGPIEKAMQSCKEDYLKRLP